MLIPRITIRGREVVRSQWSGLQCYTCVKWGEDAAVEINSVWDKIRNEHNIKAV